MSSYTLRQPGKDKALGNRLMDATQDVPRFGYRRMAAWLDVGEARVHRLWRSLGLHLPRKRSRRRRSGCDMRLPGAGPTASGATTSCTTSSWTGAC